MVQNQLYHHGIKGQKWGVRRTPAQLGHRIKSTFSRKKKKKVKKVEEQPKKKTAKDMTDEELRSAIKRMTLEQEYNNLHPAEISQGKKFVKKMMEKVVEPAAEDVAKQLVKSGMTKAVNEILNLDEEFKVYTNNKKK